MELTNHSPLANGWTACWWDDADGSTDAWIMASDREAPNGCACAQCVPHDQLGPLPNRFARRLARAKLRCGAPCASGRPCRNQVGRPGDHCRWHRGDEHR